MLPALAAAGATGDVRRRRRAGTVDAAQEKEKAVGNNRCSDYEASRPCAAASCDGNGERGQAGLAQLVEHVICNHGVTGSNPVAGTT